MLDLVRICKGRAIYAVKERQLFSTVWLRITKALNTPIARRAIRAHSKQAKIHTKRHKKGLPDVAKSANFAVATSRNFKRLFYSVARTVTSKCAVLPSIAHSKHNIYLRAIYTVLYLSFTYIVRAIWTVHCLKAREGRKKVRNISKAQTSAVSVNFLKTTWFRREYALREI